MVKLVLCITVSNTDLEGSDNGTKRLVDANQAVYALWKGLLLTGLKEWPLKQIEVNQNNIQIRGVHRRYLFLYKLFQYNFVSHHLFVHMNFTRLSSAIFIHFLFVHYVFIFSWQLWIYLEFCDLMNKTLLTWFVIDLPFKCSMVKM